MLNKKNKKGYLIKIIQKLNIGKNDEEIQIKWTVKNNIINAKYIFSSFSHILILKNIVNSKVSSN